MSTFKGAYIVVICAILLHVVGGCDRTKDAEPTRSRSTIPLAQGAAKGFHVLLVTIDTLRADHLGCYGRSSIKTPHIDKLAAEGVRFADAVTPAPITLPAHSSIFTGQIPPHHGVHLNAGYKLGPDALTMAEVLKAQGFSTAAFIGSVILNREMGLTQGFDVYDDTATDDMSTPGGYANERSAGVVIESAWKWIEPTLARGDRFFAWVHLWDPHDPYLPPDPWASEYADSPYDGEIAYADAELGKLIARLSSSGVLDETIVVVTADHGEGLGEHSETTHAHLVYESTMHVPLVLRIGSLIKSPLAIDGCVVSTCDIMPTLLALLGIGEGPSLGDFDGWSLLDDERYRSRLSSRAVYMETLWPHLVHGWAPIHAMRRHHDKFIDAPLPEYYDLVRDPHELNNLLGGGSSWQKNAPKGAVEMFALLEASPASAALTSRPSVVDDATMRRLAAVGYVMPNQPGTSSGSEIERRPLDEMISKWEADMNALRESREKQFNNMLDTAGRIAAMSLGDPEAQAQYGDLCIQAAKHDVALRCFELATRLDSQVFAYWLKLAEVQGTLQQWQGFAESLEAAERLDSTSYEVPLLRGRSAMARREYALARDSFAIALQRAGTSADRERVLRWQDELKRRTGQNPGS